MCFRCWRQCLSKEENLELEKKHLLYHSTNTCFNIYTKPLHAENEDVESENNVTTMSITKMSTPMLQKNSVPPRDQPLTENRHNANS